jgi:hypothetical protein
MLAGEPALAYADLAKRLGMANETGQGLGPVLDEAAAMCIENNLPDVSTVVVTKESMEQGCPMPSRRSFDENGFWAITGISMDEIPEYQKKVRAYDWASVPTLALR